MSSSSKSLKKSALRKDEPNRVANPESKTTAEPPPKSGERRLSDPDLYLNREIEWLRFNERVLSEAELPENPLMERLKFLAIFDSNLDEFFMVRLSGLLKLIERAERGDGNPYPDVQDPEETFDGVSNMVRALLRRHNSCLMDDVLPALRACGIELAGLESLAPDEFEELDLHFDQQIFPVLTPLAVDPAHPFPFLANISLYLAVVFEKFDDTGEPLLGFVEMPRTLDRFVCIGEKEGCRKFVLLEDLVKRNVSKLFPWTRVTEAHTFRVTRNLDYRLLEAEVKDLMKSVEFELKDRAQKIAVRLETEISLPDSVRSRLRLALDLDASDVYSVSRILALRDAWALLRLDVDARFRDAPFSPLPHPRLEKDAEIFSLIRDGDILLHHPYDSFGTVLEFLQQAAEDPDVLAIKQTLYRTGGESPVTEILTRAAENGKQVTAVVELKARFDEHTNIAWAKRLERAGVHVVFGFVGLKTHAKCVLVIRRENGKLRRYAHLSTGNYNSATAKTYTDVGLLTADEALTGDIMKLFNLLTGFNIVKNAPTREGDVRPVFSKISAAPFELRETFQGLIREECRLKKSTGKGRIIMKMNALLDPVLIRELYEASQQGVRIDLIVRGMCALRPGIPGISENIAVVSIVDRFLEHSRIFWFHQGGRPAVFLSSADLMVRNLDKRIEILLPVEDPDLQKKISDLLEMYLLDNVKSHRKLPDGTYVRNAPGEAKPFRVQERLARGAE